MLLSGGFERDTKQILATIRNQPLLRAELNSHKLLKNEKLQDDSEDEDDLEDQNEEITDENIRKKTPTSCFQCNILFKLSLL